MRYMAKKHKGALALRIEFHGRFEKHHEALCSIASNLEGVRPTSLARAVLADFCIHKSETLLKRVLGSLHEYEQLDLVKGVKKPSSKKRPPKKKAKRKSKRLPGKKKPRKVSKKAAKKQTNPEQSKPISPEKPL